MAEVVQIRGSNEQGKIRHPFGVLGLSLVTLGIYWWVWYYKVNKELADIGRAHATEECGTNPVTSLLAVTLGVFIIVPPFVSVYKTWVRKRNAARLVGAEEGLEPWIGWLLMVVVSLIGSIVFQFEMNKVMTAQAGEPGALPPQAEPTPAPAPEAPEQPVRGETSS
jgi:Domain of unknown function (DUF4234)